MKTHILVDFQICVSVPLRLYILVVVFIVIRKEKITNFVKKNKQTKKKFIISCEQFLLL